MDDVITDSDRRRKGKKIGQHHSNACPGVVNTFDIRLTAKDRFAAEYLGEWYEATTIPELKTMLDEQVKKQGPQTWEYFIQIDDVDFEKAEDRQAYWNSRERIRIQVDYRVIKLSNVITPTGHRLHRLNNEVAPYRLSRAVYMDKDGMRDEVDGDRRASVEDLAERTLIPFTPERWAALEGIAAAARELGRRMAEMLNGAKAAAFLDDRALPSLLALPAVPEVVKAVPAKEARKAGAR